MSAHPVRRRIFAALGITSGLALAMVAVIGVAHTEFGRPLLRYIPGMGACPLDVAPLTAAERLRVRNDTLVALGGEGVATSRAALAFELGSTGRTDVEHWAAEHGLQCVAGRKLALRCADVPAAALVGEGGFDEVSFDFDLDGRLVMLEGSSSVADAQSAVDYLTRRDQSLRSSLGQPTIIRGDATATAVSRGPLSQISREFRRSDVRASVIATNFGHGRFGIREFHQLIAG
jgi:hypothetical protein